MLAASRAAAQDNPTPQPNTAPPNSTQPNVIVLDEPGPPPPTFAPVQAPPAFAYPTSIEEYRVRMKELKVARGYAVAAGNFTASEAIGANIAALNGWYQQSTHKRNPGMFVGGIVLAGLGVAAVAVGSVAVAVGLNQSSFVCFGCAPRSNDAVIVAGAVTMIAGAVVGVIGIPLMIYGNKRVMNGAEDARLFVGPTGLAFRLSF